MTVLSAWGGLSAPLDSVHSISTIEHLRTILFHVGTEWPCPGDVTQSEGWAKDTLGLQEQLRGKGSGNHTEKGNWEVEESGALESSYFGVSTEGRGAHPRHTLDDLRCYRAEA